MIHQGQGASFGFEAGDHLLGIHPRLDDLEGHSAMGRLRLFGQEDNAHAALADLLHAACRGQSACRAFKRGWSTVHPQARRPAIQKLSSAVVTEAVLDLGSVRSSPHA